MTEIETADTSPTIHRTFDAPCDRLYRAFTDPDELEQWFVPEGMTAEVHVLEPEPGGAFEVSWTGGENRMDNGGTFVEVVEKERLVSVEETAGGEPRTAYEFHDADGGTEVVIVQEFPGPVPDVFQLMADSTRRRLLELTSREERSVTELVEATGLTQPAVSKQLATLRENGLVTVARCGPYPVRVPCRTHGRQAALEPLE